MRFLIITLFIFSSAHAQQTLSDRLADTSFGKFIRRVMKPSTAKVDADKPDLSSDIIYPLGDRENHKYLMFVRTNMGSGLSTITWGAQQQSSVIVQQELSTPQLITAMTIQPHEKNYLFKPNLIELHASGNFDVTLVELYNRYYLFFHQTGRFHKLDYVIEEGDKPSERQPRIKKVFVKELTTENGPEYLLVFATDEESIINKRVYFFGQLKQRFFEFQDLSKIGKLAENTLESIEKLASAEHKLFYNRTTHFPKFTNNSGSINFEGYEANTKVSTTTMRYAPVKMKTDNLKDIHDGAKFIEERLNNRFIEREDEIHMLVTQTRQIWSAERNQINTDAKKNRFVILLGGTGAGKTDLAEALADEAYEGRKILIEFNDLTSENDANAITGARAGYKNFEDLTPWEEYKKNYGNLPGVIILDELSKGATSNQAILLKLLATGKITIKGKELDFSNCLIVATSNKGADKAFPTNRTYTKAQIDERKKLFTDSKARDLLKQRETKGTEQEKNGILPEIIGRADVVAVVPPVSHEGAITLIEKDLKQIVNTYAINEQMEIRLDPQLSSIIVKENYRLEDGVRKIKSLAQKVVSSALDVAVDKLDVNSGDDIKIKYIVKGEDELIEVTKVDTGKSETFNAPRANVGRTNPLLNPQFAYKLENIPELAAQSLYGQDKAILALAKEIQARAMNNEIDRATSVILMGTTGAGKTELSKVIAYVLYGDPERRGRLDMSEVVTEDDAKLLFFGDKRNADFISKFHQILMDYPDGCVINLDELGSVGYVNASGKNEAKSGILQKLYPIFDERYITLPNGERADLKKYIFVGTTNDGQHLFQNSPSDDERLAIYEDVSKRPEANKILIESGFSEALVGRFDAVIVMAPTIQPTREKILAKFIKGTEKSFAEAHKIKSIIYSEETLKIASEIFYSHSEGARKLRRFGENNLSAEIGVALLKMKKRGPIEGAEIDLQVSDNYYNKWFFEGDRPEKRKVELLIHIRLTNGEKEDFVLDALELVDEHKLVNRNEIVVIAFHEAGHAIMNVERLTGQELRTITVRSKGDYLGYAGYKTTDSKFLNSRQDIVARIGRLLGGREAEIMFATEYLGLSVDDHEKIISSGAVQDLEEAHKLAIKAIARGGLTANNLSLPLDKEGKVKLDDPITMKEIERLLKEGEAFAKAMVNEPNNKKIIEKIALATIDKGTITGDAVRKLVKDVVVTLVNDVVTVDGKSPCNDYFKIVTERAGKN